MGNFKTQQAIKYSITHNRLPEAFLHLRALAAKAERNEFEDEIVLLESRFNGLKSSERKRITSEENLNIGFARLKHDILSLSNTIEETISSSIPKVGLSIKPASPSPRMTFIYVKRSTKEEFELEVNPNLPATKIAENILLSFEPNYKDDFLFRRARVSIQLVKILEDQRTSRLDMRKSLLENGIRERDRLAIEYDISNPLPRESVIVFEERAPSW